MGMSMAIKQERSMALPFAGLSTGEVAERTAAGKTNDSHEQTSRSIKDILRANIFTRFNALLGALFVVVLMVGSPVDGFFGLVVVINSAIGIVQELRAKRTLDKLAILHAPVAHVVRDARLQTIPVKEVVLDDVLKLSAGDQVPADGKVLGTEGLEIDESLLTGESDPVDKRKGDQILSGSIVVAGQGYMQATAVGVDSYAHKIAEQVKRFTRARSELVEGTNKLLGYISWIILVVAPLLVWGQIANSGLDWQEAAVRSIAAIVGMIPEGLVLLTSLAFMLATLALVRRKVLVQQLPAVEGLARVDVMCLDKTGTLTEGAIKLDELVVLDAPYEATAKQVLGAFSIDPSSPTLAALQEAYQDQKLPKTHMTVPFSSARKWSALSVQGGEYWIMGAPEMVWPDNTSDVRRRADALANDGKRVLLLVRTTNKPTTGGLPKALHPVALIVLSEKIRSDAAETLRFFNEQGVTLKVISGDNPRTVGAIARAVGIPVKEAFDARNLPSNIDKLAKILETHHVFGRVNPDQKRAMVKALQSKGHVVAMTGDGVNDALALKDADIGIAMGTGAGATKAIAELVLLDNKFAHMPLVLAEGRRVIANIERVANLFVIKNVYSLCLALAVTVATMPFPFLPRHLSVLSALTIGIPAFLLALAPNNQRYIPGFLRRVLRFAVPVGMVTAVFIFASYVVVTHNGGSAALASTVASGVLATIGAWVLMCLARPLKAWKLLLIGALSGIFVCLIALPFTRELLDFEVALPELLWVFGFGALGVLCVELLWRHDQRINTMKHETAEPKTTEQAESDKPHPKPWWRKYFMLLAIPAVLLAVVAGYAGYAYSVSPAAIRNPKLEHYHFRMQFVVNGAPQKFSERKYQVGYDKGGCTVDLPAQPIHFHDNKDQMVHIHWNGITGGMVLKNYGLNRIGGADGALGYRFDALPKLTKVPIHGNDLPGVSNTANLYVYSGTEAGFRERKLNDFLHQDLEIFFGVKSNFPGQDESAGIWDRLFPKAAAHAGHDHNNNEVLKTETEDERRTRINNLLGNVVIFAQDTQPTTAEVQARFDALEPLSDSTCGG